MSKKGLVKLQLHSFDSIRIKDTVCQVRVRAADVAISALVSAKEDVTDKYSLLPMSDKVIFEMIGKTEQVGYFELPMKKIYQFPHKKHIVTINCITKDNLDQTIKPDVFGSLKVSFVFLQGWVGKFDLLVDKVELVEEKLGEVQRELYIQCTVGNVASQTTLKKCQETVWFEFKELLPFTLESVPSKVEFTIKDKDMVSDQVISRLVLDPQKQGLFDQQSGKKDQRHEIVNQKSRIVLYLSSSFKLKEVL